jgi:hypothetical protein
MRAPIRTYALLLGALTFSKAVHAGFYDQPFELRLFFAVDRQSNYSSTLGRQASLAALEGGSANPGSVAWREPQQPATTVTTSFVYAPSEHGGDVFATPVSLRWQAPGQGTIAVAYAFTDTRDAGGDSGVVHSLRSDEWIGGYGWRVGEHGAAGFSIRLTSGKLVSDSRSPALGDQPVRTRTDFLTPDVSVGYATDLSSAVSVGFVGGYGRAHVDSVVTNLAPLPLTIQPSGLLVVLPPGTLLAQPDDTLSTYALRAGIGIHWNEATAFYLDATGLRLSTQHSGSQTLGRFAVGIEHAVANGFMLRAGVGLDTLGKVNLSAGLGFRPTASLDVQLAVQSNAAPEVNPEIGRTRLVASSLGWRF